MSDERSDESEPTQATAPAGTGESPEPESDAPPATPFDNPWFLPVVLAGMALWFGWDGWFNPEMDWVKFNRYGFVFLGLAAVYFAATEISNRPYLLALLFAAYAIWLGLMGLASPDPELWYADAPVTVQVNRYAAGAFALFAVVSALRERARLARASS